MSGSKSTLDGELGGPLVPALVLLVLILVVGLDVPSHVVVGEVLAAELASVVQLHKLGFSLGLLVVLSVTLELGRSNLLATLTSSPGPLKRIKKSLGVRSSCFLRLFLRLLSTSKIK